MGKIHDFIVGKGKNIISKKLRSLDEASALTVN